MYPKIKLYLSLLTKAKCNPPSLLYIKAFLQSYNEQLTLISINLTHTNKMSNCSEQHIIANSLDPDQVPRDLEI